MTAHTQVERKRLLLWYRTSADTWHEALPLGNGRVGAMVFGGSARERLMLNEDTLVSGYPTPDDDFEFRGYLDETRKLIFDGRYVDAQKLIETHMRGGRGGVSYQPMGDVYFDFENHAHVEAYRRELDLVDGISRVRYSFDGALHERECFCSAPDGVVVWRTRSEKPSGVSFFCSVDSALNHTCRKTAPNEIWLQGFCPVRAFSPGSRVEDPVVYDAGKGMFFQIRVRVIATGGGIETHGNRLVVSGADSAVALIATATSFNGFDRNPASGGKDVSAVCDALLDKAEGKSYEKLKNRHVEDHRRLFDRVTIDLGDTGGSDLPTDERIEALKQSREDPDLAALFFQYGRYLLMASSRPGTQPANLQGIWNESVRPPWSCNMTTNINLEMNYWLAEPCNLPECHIPMFDMLRELAVTGARIAKGLYGCRGWAAHHGVDLWRHAAASGGNAAWSFWPMTGPWLSQHLWDHYEFGGDEKYLREVAYPIMKGAAEFCVDWLIDDGKGHLVTSPSTSPENTFLTPEGERSAVSMASTMDMSLIWQLFAHCIDASRILDVDADFRADLEEKLARLYPLAIGKRGQLQEWFLDFDEAEPGHRHVAHMYPLHPGNRILVRRDTELAAACRMSLDLRRAHEGEDTIGWCFSWYISLFARLLDAETSWSYLVKLLKNPFPNLLNAHRHPKLTFYPVTLEANYGATAGIGEMLLQSHAGEIDLLPALPAAWPSGRVAGMRARGGFGVDLSWYDGKLVDAVIRSTLGRRCRVRAHAAVGVKTKDGAAVDTEEKDGRIVFDTTPGEVYRVKAQPAAS